MGVLSTFSHFTVYNMEEIYFNISGVSGKNYIYSKIVREDLKTGEHSYSFHNNLSFECSSGLPGNTINTYSLVIPFEKQEFQKVRKILKEISSSIFLFYWDIWKYFNLDLME